MPAPALVFASSRLPVFFFVGSVGLLGLEMSSVWLIMPMPGSQRMRSVGVAYALHRTRWLWRTIGWALLLTGFPAVMSSSGIGRWAALAVLFILLGATYAFNFRMKADKMFRQPRTLDLRPANTNAVAADRLVVGVAINGDARAYPIQFIGYHHQVRDVVGGEAVMVTYCTVCRTGRVFSPIVDGVVERFRLVGMDLFNAMFEDETSGSWWRQVSGEAITGPRAGAMLAELPSQQVTLRKWFSLHPHALVMQGDPAFVSKYPVDNAYESGASRRALTGTDAASWGEKSWVIGIAADGKAKAYDWHRLRAERVINDDVAGIPIVLAIASDDASFVAFRRPDASIRFTLDGDTLVTTSARYTLGGVGTAGALEPIAASQEFWHSWRTFQPATERY